MAATDSSTTRRSTGNRRPKSLILDVFGRYSPQLKGWIAVSDLIHLMELLGVDEQATRSAISRMTRRRLVKPEVRGKVRGYRTTPEADRVFADADRRIYVSFEPADVKAGWVLASFSLPESERNKRHVLRSKLMWHGMGNLSSGLWIGPARILDDLKATLEEEGFADCVDLFTATYEGLGDARGLVERSWDLRELADSYGRFLEEYEPVRASLARRRSPVGGDEAFAIYTRALHEWRKFPYLDPGLPEELVGDRWPGHRAAELFAGLRTMLEPAAFDYVASVVGPRDR